MILLFCCLFTSFYVHSQENIKAEDLLQKLNAKGEDFSYANIPGTHIFLRLVNNKVYSYSGRILNWSEGAECTISEFYGIDLEEIVAYYQTICGNGTRRDTVVNGTKAVVIKGELKLGVNAQTLILSEHKRVAAIMLLVPNNILDFDRDVFQKMLYSAELHSEAKVNTDFAMSLAPFTIDWTIANNLANMKKEIESKKSTMDKSPPLPIEFFAMNEASYEFTNGGVEPGNENTMKMRILHTMKSDFDGDAKAYLRQCISNYGLENQNAINTNIEKQTMNGDTVLTIAYKYKKAEDSVDSDVMIFVYEDQKKFVNLIVAIRPNKNPFKFRYFKEQAYNMAKAIKIRTLE